MSELRIDRHVSDETHNQSSEIFLYPTPHADSAAALTVAEPPPPDQPHETKARPVASRLEDCVNAQLRAIRLLEHERIKYLEAGQVVQLEHHRSQIHALLREAIRQERQIVQECRTLQAEVNALRAERDALTAALRHTETLNLIDDLTELPNRRACIKRLEQELNRRQRTGQPLALVMLDIDNFKDMNDEHGHHIGDQILRRFARGMVRELRQHDMLARYGGEEFVLLLPETTLHEAGIALDKLARRLENEPLDTGSALIDLPTFSAGIASLRENETALALINRADQCLYRAKRLGRRRIETDGSSPPTS